LGSQLAWGGWRMGNRLSVYGEVLPLPQLFSLDNDAADGFFSDQRDDGSKPFGSDLDDNLGYTARIKWQEEQSFNIQLSHVDNQGDRELHRGEYAWDTSFSSISFQTQINPFWELLGEFSAGKTGMGGGAAAVDVDFRNSYLMASRNEQAHRISIRFDNFELIEKDFSPGENNQDKGNAWTLAWLYQTVPEWRLGIEFLHLSGDRPGLAQSDELTESDDDILTFEVRYIFD